MTLLNESSHEGMNVPVAMNLRRVSSVSKVHTAVSMSLRGPETGLSARDLWWCTRERDLKWLA